MLSNNGPHSAAVLWQSVLKVLAIDTNYATPYHPQTKRQVMVNGLIRPQSSNCVTIQVNM